MNDVTSAAHRRECRRNGASSSGEPLASVNGAGRRPKLCVLLPSHWAAQMGGAEYQTHLLLERLLARDLFEIHYVARNVPPAWRPDSYSLHRIGGGRRVAGTFLADVPGLWRLLKRLAPDVIYQRVGCAYTGVAVRYARRYGRRSVWHVSSDRDLLPLAGSWSVRAPLQRIEKSLLEYGARNADAVIVQNRRQGELLRHHYGRDCTAHIANFHPCAAEPAARPDDRVRVCWIANMKPLKRPELFVRLAEELRHLHGVEFVMAGAALPQAAAWRVLEARMRGVPALKYLGAQPLAAINELLAGAHVLVNTSDYEGFSNTFIQAWLREVPVVSLNVNPDGVFDGDEYGLGAHGSFDELRRAVERLVTAPLLRAQIGRRARRFAEQRFSESNADAVIELLSTSVAGAAHRRRQAAPTP